MTGCKHRFVILQNIMCEFIIIIIIFCEKCNLIMYILSVILGMIGSGGTCLQLNTGPWFIFFVRRFFNFANIRENFLGN